MSHRLAAVPLSLMAWCVLAAAFAQEQPPAQEPETPKTVLDEMIVIASRSEARVFDVPYTASVIGNQRMLERGAATLPDALREDPGIMVQKTSQGQGSPFLRGFTGFRTLFLIDGIRLNNSTFRDGPNQYWNTVDPLTVSRLEIVKGPSSVLYGSDAIGGTVNAITREPEWRGEGVNVGGRTVYRFGSADLSNIGRVEVESSVDDTFAILAGGSLKYFNDVRAGSGTGEQPKTGYQEADGDVKMQWAFDPDSQLVLAFQRVGQDDIWRTHRTIYATDWHGIVPGTDRKLTFDQERDLTYLQYRATRLGPMPGNATLSLSWQQQNEDQYRLRSNLKSEHSDVDVGTLGISAAFENVDIDTLGLLSYGFELYQDHVNSSGKTFRANGTLESIAVQGPVADDATYDLLGVFLQDEFPIAGRLSGIAGLRYTHAEADAGKMLDPITKAQGSIDDAWDNVSGSFRLLYGLTDEWNLFTGVSQGFRAPNLSDLTRLDIARTNEKETPSPGLDPEKYLSCEFGTKLNHERWTGTASYYYTFISDMIVRYPTGRIVDGLNEVQKSNDGDGFVHGVELRADYRLTEQWMPFAGIAWQEGLVDGYAAAGSPKEREAISKLPPLMSTVGVRWTPPSRRGWIEGECRMAGRQDKLSAADKLDNRIPPGGTPGYAVFNLRGGIDAAKNVAVTAAVENIADTDYRIHGSGQNEPGTNLVAGVECKF